MLAFALQIIMMQINIQFEHTKRKSNKDKSHEAQEQA